MMDGAGFREAVMADDVRAAVEWVCRQAGLDAGRRRLLRRHASVVVRVDEAVVVKLAPATPDNLTRSTTAVRMASWLVSLGFPAVRPAYPSALSWIPESGGSGWVATLWEYLPQPAQPVTPRPVAPLGRLLRELHQLPAPSFTLPTVRPLRRLCDTVTADAARPTPVLSAGDRAFLTDRIDELLTAYAGLRFALPSGVIHNDAYPGNLLVDPRSRYGYVLADWDPAGIGPREIDLIAVGAPENRFGRDPDERRLFVAAYGWDVASWEGWRVLAAIRELHSIGAYLRAAPVKPAALAELRLRLETLRTGDRSRLWHVVP